MCTLRVDIFTIQERAPNSNHCLENECSRRDFGRNEERRGKENGAQGKRQTAQATETRVTVEYVLGVALLLV